ncbi:MAG: VWA domain-containing protein [Pyrinomonadaceae bacterium]
MVRQFYFAIFFLLSAASIFAQSGRIKVPEKPTPTPVSRPPRVVYVPTQTDSEIASPKTTPAQPADGTDDGAVIRIESTLVPIPVSVTDANGKVVDNLKLEDFQLEVDGKEAVISEMFRSQTPVRLALLFDNSSSVTTARDFEKNAAIRFFRQVIRPDKDLAALYSVATYSRLEQPLTKNVSSLVSAIENFDKPEGATALLDGIVAAADYLKKTDGRRVIVIVSDGEDTYSDLSTTLEKTVKAVQSANCQVYIVKTTDFENFKQSGIRGGNANIRSLTAERRMQELANQTGGAVYSPIDERELDAAFMQISAELGQQYILNYYPKDNAANGAFRTISLKIKSPGNLTVRTRKGYYVSKR